MTEEKPKTVKRPFWQRKTEIGMAITIVGEIMALIPATAPVSSIVVKIGILIAGVGVVHRNIKGQVQ